MALQLRWDRVHKALNCRSVGDYAGMMRTGIVCRKLRMIAATAVEEYEIDVSAIEALNSVEKRAAIETGQEQENVSITGNISAKSIALSKVLTIPELEEIERKMLAAMEAERQGKAITPGQGAGKDENIGELKEEGQEPPRSWRD